MLAWAWTTSGTTSSTDAPGRINNPSLAKSWPAGSACPLGFAWRAVSVGRATSPSTTECPGEGDSAVAMTSPHRSIVLSKWSWGLLAGGVVLAVPCRSAASGLDGAAEHAARKTARRSGAVALLRAPLAVTMTHRATARTDRKGQERGSSPVPRARCWPARLPGAARRCSIGSGGVVSVGGSSTTRTKEPERGRPNLLAPGSGSGGRARRRAIGGAAGSVWAPIDSDRFRPEVR